MKNIVTLLAALSVASVLPTASAQIVYSLNWQTGGTSPGYDQADPGAITSLSTVANGPGGTLARNLTFDTTTEPFSIQYFANYNTKLFTPTSGNAADYILSFDVRAVGLANGNDGNGQFETVFNDARFQSSFSATSSFQTISIALSDMTLVSGTFEASDFDSGTQQFKLNQLGVSGVGRYGQKAGNALIFDNVTLTAVPEPSTVALLGLGAAGLAIFARRRRA